MCFCNSHKNHVHFSKTSIFSHLKRKECLVYQQCHQFLTSLFLILNIFEHKKGTVISVVVSCQSTNISFSCYVRSETRKWMRICRFEIKNIFLFDFRLIVLLRFRWSACAWKYKITRNNSGRNFGDKAWWFLLNSLII